MSDGGCKTCGGPAGSANCCGGGCAICCIGTAGCCGSGVDGLVRDNALACWGVGTTGCCGYGVNGLVRDNALTCWGIQLEDDGLVGYCIPGNEPTDGSIGSWGCGASIDGWG